MRLLPVIKPRHIPLLFAAWFFLLFVSNTSVEAALPRPFFSDAFTNKLDEGWSWIRENREGWRITPDGLQIRIQPGNMWGPPNDARNLLVRSVPHPGSGSVAVEVTFENRPTEQYEQMDLVWYHDDSNMVKLGFELVDGKRCIVMGTETRDRTRTISILAHARDSVRLRLVATANTLRGEYQFPGSSQDWMVAGVCEIADVGAPRIAIQCYQGPGHLDRWGLIKDFVVYALPDPTASVLRTGK